MKKFVLTGGPCAGKTTALAYIEQKMADRGFHPLFVTESPTLLMAGNAKPGIYDEKVFQCGIIRTMRSLEDTFAEIGRSRPELNPIVFFDRGIPDCQPYMPHGSYPKALLELGLGSEVEVRDGRYDAVFHMRSAALGAEESYTLANNAARRETPEEARVRDHTTLAAWIGHPHLRVIDNSTDFEGKLKRLEREICAALGIPVPLEIERKFACEPLSWENILVACQDISIEQTYLQSCEPDVVLRVRKRGQHGSYVYYRTEKRDIRAGVRAETEERISREVYEACLAFRKPGTQPIRKQRWCFVYEHQYFELDLIPRNDGTLYLLEIELTEQNQEVRLPPFISVKKEVTDNPAYSNYALSHAA
jgi:CYTH domain-containing protein/predicted ATPase